MTILSDRQIAELSVASDDQQDAFQPMIKPFCEQSIRSQSLTVGDAPDAEPLTRKVLSYGLSSFGYDVQLAESFKLFTNVNSRVVDPKRMDERCLIDAEVQTDEDGARYVILPPNSYLLGHTVEVFDIPRDVMVVCVGKSTYARAGAIVNVTPIEAGFKGSVVIEISNATTLPLKIYAGEGCAQFLFFRGNEECQVSYADRSGKYQNQQGVTLSKV